MSRGAIARRYRSHASWQAATAGRLPAPRPGRSGRAGPGGPAQGQKAKTALPFRVADMTQALGKVCFQATRLPCHTPSAVTVTGS